jgi:lipoprotein-releasing system permease protein
MLILMVADKTKEIGTLTALGATPKSIARIFMLQGVAIGAVGATTGLALGWTLATLFDRYELFKLDPDVYYLTHLPFSPHVSDLLWVGLATMLISFVATLYPAFKAAALDPVEAIRHE